MSETETRAQVVAQYEVVAHLATQIAVVHADMAKMIKSGAFDEGMVRHLGEASAALMEHLGDALSNMDAVTEDDNWTDPVFAKAQEMFPPPEKTDE